MPCIVHAVTVGLVTPFLPFPHSSFQPPQPQMMIPGMDFPQLPQMMGAEYGIRGRGSGSSNEGVSPAMIGMGGFKKEKLDAGYGDTVESEWVYCLSVRVWHRIWFQFDKTCILSFHGIAYVRSTLLLPIHVSRKVKHLECLLYHNIPEKCSG